MERGDREKNANGEEGWSVWISLVFGSSMDGGNIRYFKGESRDTVVKGLTSTMK